MLHTCCDGLISGGVFGHEKISLVGWVLIGMAAAAGPLRVSANGDPLASPKLQPTPWATAPGISGENPDVHRSEGEQGEIAPSDNPGVGGSQPP
ncbi:MAG: hypothetical protein P8Y37_05250 [Anaerolineales bacterium]